MDTWSAPSFNSAMIRLMGRVMERLKMVPRSKAKPKPTAMPTPERSLVSGGVGVGLGQGLTGILHIQVDELIHQT